MVYMYLQPDEGFDKRYLVFRPFGASGGSLPENQLMIQRLERLPDWEAFRG